MAGKMTAVAEATNDAEEAFDARQPYAVEIAVEGTAPILFHRWSVEAVEDKGNARKGSRAKKTDNVESYVYRMESGQLAIPGEYFRQAIVNAAKFRQDPRSPRKSAMDLFKAAIIVTDELCGLGVKTWDYLDRRRVQVQRNGITRARPAMMKGWQTVTRLECVLAEYIEPTFLHEVVEQAGRLVGVGDYRPTYGRFAVTRFKVL